MLVPSDSGKFYVVSAYDFYLHKYPGATIPESALPPVEERVSKKKGFLFLSAGLNFFCIYQALMQKYQIDCFDNIYRHHCYGGQSLAEMESKIFEIKISFGLHDHPAISMNEQFNQLYQNILLKQIQYEEADLNDQKRIIKEIVFLVESLLTYIKCCYYEQNHKNLEEDIENQKMDSAMCSFIGCKNHCYLNSMDVNLEDNGTFRGECRKKIFDLDK